MAYDDTTDEIRRRADIVEVIEQYVALRPAGNNRFKACCPFHDEKTPSFYVSRDKGFYKCFGCGKSGDSFKFLQEIENVPFIEAKRQLAEKYGVELRAQRDLTPEQQVAFLYI
jgi:DNA primase